LSDPDSGPTYWQQTITHMKQNYDTVISSNLSRHYHTNAVEY